MIDKLVKSEIVQLKTIISAAEFLHFDSFITRFIKSGYRGRVWGELISC